MDGVMSHFEERRQRASSIFRTIREQAKGSAARADGGTPDNGPESDEGSQDPGNLSSSVIAIGPWMEDGNRAEDGSSSEDGSSDEDGSTHGARLALAPGSSVATDGGVVGPAPGDGREGEPMTEPEPGPVAAPATTVPEPAMERLKHATQELSSRRYLGEVPATKPPLPRILAIANQKGGVGKTTTAVNLGAALAELGYRVLIVDLDPQGNATTGLGVNARNLDASVYDVILHDVAIEDCIEPTNLRNLFLVPATIDLAGAEIELVPAFSRELRLKRALEPVMDDFDFVLIDCPPSLGLLTVNALAAAGEVAVPIQCEYYALEGLGQLLNNIERVRSNLNPLLVVSTIILTMYDARTRLAEQVVDEVRHHFGERVCRSVVPRTVRLSEAPSFGQPIIVFDSSSRGATAYRELAKEVSGGAAQRVG
jgi:chromosome partitioning protein